MSPFSLLLNGTSLSLIVALSYFPCDEELGDTNMELNNRFTKLHATCFPPILEQKKNAGRQGASLSSSVFNSLFPS
jgi:hypothetical protein